ncbi:tumor necrosis factor receptor superfamily member 10A [Macaca fascicularis]|uniref:TNF receptor superfamily member 10a n=1 Tax=Macaca mulatta TaxID=9544 RepID=F6TP00_MACMU|nr:tumor necrosis factor receptor superfamily member 10A [Macaca mulatta]XP_015309893.2 tumor necrosis factor receptor superfamily member 10A [Macaca fascicularis]
MAPPPAGVKLGAFLAVTPNPGSAASGTEAATATPSKVWGSSAGRIEPRGGGRGALPTSMGQQGPSAQARAGRVVGPRSAQGASPGLRVHKTLKFVVVGVLLQVVPGSAATIKVHDQSVGTQQWEHSPLGELCPPGSHRSEHSGACNQCTEGVGYTSASNNLFSCLPCTACKSDEEERSACTRTRNTACQCKPGTFRNDDSAEMCRKCSTGCPRGKVKVKDCTPWSDIECVHNESGNGHNVWAILIVIVVILVVLLLLVAVLMFCRRIGSGCGGNPKCMHRVFLWCLGLLRGPGAEDNAHNMILNHGDSLSTFISEQQMESQEPADLTGVTVQSPGEAQCLLGPAEPEGSQRRRLLVPANGADPTETMMLFFDNFADIVPFNSWDQLMRQLGLTNNEIHMVRADTAGPGDALYAMLMKWVNKTGQDASIHTLLDALERIGERHAKERIQDLLVDSGKFIYVEDGTGSAVSLE